MNKDVKKILIETNQQCNLNCTYCFYNDIGRNDDFLTLNHIKKICEKYSNANEFYLTGGECTLNGEFQDIVDYLSSKGKITIFTNGLNFIKFDDLGLKNIVNKTHKFIITYDSNNPNYILRKGLEKNVVDSIKKILDIDKEKVEIKICLSKLNFNDFEITIKFLIKLGVKHISINYIKNIMNTNINFELSDEEINKTFLIINKYKKYFDKENIEFIQKSYKEKFKNSVQCIAGEKFIYIDCSGKVFYCPSSCKKIDDKKNNNCFGKHCINLWEMFI